MGRAFQRRIDRGLVAQLVKERLVAGIVGPDRGRARRRRRRGAGQDRQRLVRHLDRLGGVAGDVERLGDDEGHRLAGAAHAPLRQERLRRHERGGAAAALPRHVRAQRAEAAGAQIIARQHREHARHLLRAAHVDRRDVRMRVRRAQHEGARLARHAHVVDIAALPAQKLRVFLARHRLSHPVKSHDWLLYVV